MSSLPKIIIRQRQPNDRALKTLSTLAAAAEHLDCTITTVKMNIRKLQGDEFYGKNVKTGASCFFMRAKHNNKLTAIKVIDIRESCEVFTVKSKAATFLDITPTALDHKLSSPGIWLVRNVLNNRCCYVKYTPRKSK